MKRTVRVSAPLLAMLGLAAAGPFAAVQELLPQSVAYAAAQSLLTRPAKLDAKDVTLVEALTALRQRADVNIIFSPSLLPKDRRVSCACAHATVREALNRILEGTGFDYFEMPLQIVIRAPESPGRPLQVSPSGPPAYAFASLAVREVVPQVAHGPLRQDTVVAGVVVNAETELPLSNAVVVVAGTSRSGLTDAQGRFRIAGLEQNAAVTLQVRLLGYGAASSTVAAGAENVRIALQPAAIALEGVVVSALGIERERRALGYSVASVTPDEATVNRTPNFIDALQGKMAGVNITSLGTGPQGSTKVRIRGQSSFGGNNSPLIVVNGVPIDNTNFGVSGDVAERGSHRNSDSGDGLSSINPDDITNITVLKGAAAAALYGSRAKDGVIMITTRNRAAAPGIQWQYTSNVTHETPLDYRDYQMEYGQGEGGARPTAGRVQDSGVWSFGERLQPGMTQNLFGVEIPYQPQPNQLREYYRNGVNFSNTITISQSGENGGVSASVSRLSSRAILDTSDYTRHTINVGFTQLVANRYSISGNINYAHEDRENPPNIAEQDYSPVVIYTLANSLPTSFLREMAFTDEGDERRWSRFTNRTNPYFALSRFENNIRDRIYGNLTGRADLASWLFLQARVGQDYYSRDQDYNLPTGSQRQDPAPPGFVNGQYVQDEVRFREFNADFLLGANRRFERVGVGASFGGNLMRRRFERNNVLVQDFYTRGSYTLGNGRLLSPNHSLSERQVNSLYGTAELALRDMVFLNGTLRNDWFSTLSPQNRSILYPSLATSFVFTEAFPAPRWLGFGKLRAAYAEVGSDTDVPPYAHNLFYAIEPNLFQNQPLGSISGSVVPNPNLRPMRLSEWEVGMELNLWDALTLDVGYYHRTSRDQILNQQVSTASGFATQRINVGRSRNTGIEFLLEATPLRRERLSWTTSFNGSHNQSKVLDLGTDLGVEQITVGLADFHGELRQVVGQPLNQLYGWGWLRDEQGRQVFNPNNGIPLRSTEQLAFGSALPVWVGGITNRLNYGSLAVGFLVDFKLGHKMISGTHINAYRHGLDKATLVGREQNCVVGVGVKPNGTPNDICAPLQTFYEAVRTHQTSEQSVFDAGSWQLRQISIGYDLSRFLPERSGMNALEVSAVANNVAVLKKWAPHIHPDQGGIFSDARMGLEATGLPVTRGIGINLTARF